jgi:hypothetical protein
MIEATLLNFLILFSNTTKIKKVEIYNQEVRQKILETLYDNRFNYEFIKKINRMKLKK